MVPNVPNEIYHYVLEFLSYENLFRVRLTSRLFYSIGSNLIKHTPIIKNRWAWANERLKLNKNVIISNTSKYEKYCPLFLWRLGLKVRFHTQKRSLSLIIQSVYHTSYELLIHQQMDDKIWWYENIKSGFVPARLTPNKKDMDLIVCDLNNECGETIQIAVDLSDPANIDVIHENIEEKRSIPISEFYYIIYNNISLLKNEGLVCENTLWGYTLEHSDHTESEHSNWAMIRTFHNVYYHLYQFENNLQIKSQCIVDFENCHGNLRSVGAGKYIIKLKRNGDLWVFISKENIWLQLQYDKRLLPITKMIESHYNGNNIIVVRDLENIVIVINTKVWCVTELSFCKPHSRFHMYFDFRNNLLNWVDYDEISCSHHINL